MTIALIIAQCGVILDTVVKQNKEKYELELIRYKQIENLKNIKLISSLDNEVNVNGGKNESK